MTGTFQREPAFRTAFLVLAHAVFHGAGSGPDFRRGDVQDFFPESGGYLFSVLAFAASGCRPGRASCVRYWRQCLVM